MKKTISVNIGGWMFHVDEDAYQNLQQYLEKIRSYFKQNEACDEIMHDIEQRIAELFKEYLKGGREVINTADVEAMIAVMGKPEDYQDEATAQAPESATPKPGGKRLYRDPDHKVLGGVCGGLGAYFNIDPIIFRVAFAFAFIFWGTGLLLYIILWIAMPEAKTTAEKLEMRGESVTISNIEKTIKTEWEQVQQRVSNLSSQDTTGKFTGFIQAIVQAIAQILRGLIKPFRITIGIFLLFFSLITLIAFVWGLSSDMLVQINDGTQTTAAGLNDILTLFFDGQLNFEIPQLSILFLIGIPLVAILITAIRLIFSLTFKTTYITWTLTLLWIAAFAGGVYTVAQGSKQFKVQSTEKQKLSIQKPYVLTITTFADPLPHEFIDDVAYINEDGTLLAYTDVSLSIHPNMSDTSLYAVVEKSSRGANKQLAEQYNQQMNYTLSQHDSTLFISRFAQFGTQTPYRNQQVHIRVFVPQGQHLFLDPSLDDYLINTESLEGLYDNDLVNETFIMTAKGLQRKNSLFLQP